MLFNKTHQLLTLFIVLVRLLTPLAIKIQPFTLQLFRYYFFKLQNYIMSLKLLGYTAQKKTYRKSTKNWKK